MTGADLAREYMAVPYGELPGEPSGGAHVKPSRRKRTYRKRERNARKVERVSDSGIGRLASGGFRFQSPYEMREYLLKDMKENRRDYGIGFIESFFIQELLMWIVRKLVEYLFDRYKS